MTYYVQVGVVLSLSPLLTYAAGSHNSQELHLDSACERSRTSALWMSGERVCDLSLTHITNVSGASFPLVCFGQPVPPFGHITGGMVYEVIVDGSVSIGTRMPSGQVLARVLVPRSTMGGHNVILISKLSGPGVATTLQFEKAVGTGLTDVKANRSIQQDDEFMQYMIPSTSAGTTDRYSIPQLSWNTTFCVPGDTPGSIPWSGNAILVYGAEWSSISSMFQASVDPQDPVTLFLDSSPPKNYVGLLLSDDFLFVRFNSLGSSRTLNGDDYNGEGQFGLDYIKIDTVTSGSSPSQPYMTLIVLSFFAIIVALDMFDFSSILHPPDGPGEGPAARDVLDMQHDIPGCEDLAAEIDNRAQANSV